MPFALLAAPTPITIELKLAMAHTVLENLSAEAVRIRQDLNELLAKSSVERWYDPRTAKMTWLGGHFSWQPLGDEGRQIQARALDEYRKFVSIIRVLLRGQPDITLDKVKQADELVLAFIQQNELLFRADRESYLREANKGLATLIEALGGLYGQPGAGATFVPDTNALIFNPALENWCFSEASQFVVILTAPVLSELDALKTNHRVDAVREKAERVIRQLKEYRRRAVAAGRRLADGVDLLSGTSQVMTLAVEPEMGASLPWLDPGNMDDRILANVIEVMRMRPRSPVWMVTRDINLQNKAEYANIPFVEPPDPI